MYNMLEEVVLISHASIIQSNITYLVSSVSVRCFLLQGCVVFRTHFVGTLVQKLTMKEHSIILLYVYPRCCDLIS